ncbi:MAG TPA: methionyl-tRNA formyltransferase [Phycisphaerae bacterium]|nr:methionyl-tRNA formyltransferase [Phycisphaerae bacterium]
MRIIVAASGEFAVPSLRCLSNSDHEIAFVLTQPDRVAGRGRKTKPTPVREAAEHYGLKVIPTDDINSAEILERVKAAQARVGVVAAFGQKIGPDLLEAMPGGWVNLHASLLPAYRGASPIHRAVLDRQAESGVTVFRLVQRMDAGPILVTRRTAIKPEETTDELHDRLARVACDAIKVTLDMFEDGIPDGIPQDESLVTKAPKLRKEDGRIDFSRTTEEVAAHILGMWDWPGASCRFVSADGKRNERVILARARPAETTAKPTDGATPGQIGEQLYVATGDGFLELLEIKPESGHVMPWPDFVNGRHVQAGDRFES